MKTIVCENLKKFRDSSDYSQLDVAQFIGIERGAYANYESGNEGVVIGDYGIKAKQLFSDMKISESHYYELMNSIGIDPTIDTHE